MPFRRLQQIPFRARRARWAFVLAATMLGFASHVAAAPGGDIDGSTSTAMNRAPSFGAASATRSVAENTAPGHAAGSPVRATDPDPGDTLSYRLEGADATAFDIVSTSGQIRTKAALDHESKSSYTVTVVAQDSRGAGATIAVTIAVTDRIEPPLAPDAPAVGSVVGSDTSLAVRWTAPANTGRPVIRNPQRRGEHSGGTGHR